MSIIFNKTSVTANDNSGWQSIVNVGRFPKEKLLVQGYWENGAGTYNGQLYIDLTMDSTLADSKSMFDSADVVQISAAAGAFTFLVETYGFKYYRLRYVENSLTSIDLYAISTGDEL